MRRVKIKTWDAMEKEFGLGEDGDLNMAIIFTPYMEKLMPADRVIEVERDGGRFLWEGYMITEDMIECEVDVDSGFDLCESPHPFVSEARKSPFTDDSAKRKEYPVYSGCLNYFPDAIAEVCRLSFKANQKHNPGEALHWSKGKSSDHKDCIARHLIDGDPISLAWRALANLQTELENGYDPQKELAQCENTDTN